MACSVMLVTDEKNPQSWTNERELRQACVDINSMSLCT